MTQLFATHCTQKGFSITLTGQYDPEQELWVGDNLPQAAIDTIVSQTGTHSSTTPSHYTKWTKVALLGGGFFTVDDGSGTDADPYNTSDTDGDGDL